MDCSSHPKDQHDSRVPHCLARPVSAPEEFAEYMDKKRHKKNGVKRAKSSLLLYVLAKGTEEAEELRGVPDLLHVCPCFSATRGVPAMSAACARPRLFLCHQDSHCEVLQECYCMSNTHPVSVHMTL